MSKFSSYYHTYMWSLNELRKLPTLATGQADDLKLEDLDLGYRVWLSRCSIADGEPYNNKVSVERYVGNRWKTVREFQAIDDSDDDDEDEE